MLRDQRAQELTAHCSSLSAGQEVPRASAVERLDVSRQSLGNQEILPQ